MLNKGNRVPNQLHEGVIKGKFPSRISDFPCKRNIFLNMSSNLNRPFDMAVIVEKTLVFLVKSLAQSRLKILWKKINQELIPTILLR